MNSNLLPGKKKPFFSSPTCPPEDVGVQILALLSNQNKRGKVMLHEYGPGAINLVRPMDNILAGLFVVQDSVCGGRV